LKTRARKAEELRRRRIGRKEAGRDFNRKGGEKLTKGRKGKKSAQPISGGKLKRRERREGLRHSERGKTHFV